VHQANICLEGARGGGDRHVRASASAGGVGRTRGGAGVHVGARVDGEAATPEHGEILAELLRPHHLRSRDQQGDGMGDQGVAETGGIVDEVAAHGSDVLPYVAGVGEQEPERGPVGGVGVEHAEDPEADDLEAGVEVGDGGDSAEVANIPTTRSSLEAHHAEEGGGMGGVDVWTVTRSSTAGALMTS